MHHDLVLGQEKAGSHENSSRATMCKLQVTICSHSRKWCCLLVWLTPPTPIQNPIMTERNNSWNTITEKVVSSKGFSFKAAHSNEKQRKRRCEFFEEVKFRLQKIFSLSVCDNDSESKGSKLGLNSLMSLINWADISIKGDVCGYWLVEKTIFLCGHFLLVWCYMMVSADQTRFLQKTLDDEHYQVKPTVLLHLTRRLEPYDT